MGMGKEGTCQCERDKVSALRELEVSEGERPPTKIQDKA